MSKVILTEKEIKNIISTLAKKIVSKYKSLSNVFLVGIHTNGVFIANRLKEEIKKISKKTLKTGVLDITFYRDDIGYRDITLRAKDTQIDFNVDNKDIILVDDVIYTGRTIRAAMEQLLEIGRPKTISVLVLIDRGLRELPIYAEFVGKKLKTEHNDQIEVFLKEQNKEDKIVLYKK